MYEINRGRNDFSRGAELVHHRSLIKDIETNLRPYAVPISAIGPQIKLQPWRSVTSFLRCASDVRAKERENGVKDGRLPLRNKRRRSFFFFLF